MSPNRKSLALAAGLLVSALIFVAVLVPHEAPRTFLNQLRAVKNIQKVIVAEQRYAAEHPDLGFACSLSALRDEHPDSSSAREPLVDSVLASGTKSGYIFEIRCSNRKATEYTVAALPAAVGKSGNYAICSDQSGIIWYSENGSASDCLTMRKPIDRQYTQ